MKISAIEVQGHDRRTVRIQTGHEFGTVQVIVGTQCKITFTFEDLTAGRRDESWAKVLELVKLIYGTDKKGRPAATNSMAQDVADLIDRVSSI